MAIYSVLKIMGVAYAFAGPWPFDMEACRSEGAVVGAASIDHIFYDDKKREGLELRWPGIKRKDMEWVCVESEKEPEISAAPPVSAPAARPCRAG